MKKIDTTLFLAQSYQDTWEDYRRSLETETFPAWDCVILTASNEHQAESYRAQLEARRGFLPARTRFAVVPDENGVRVGSGGATLAVLRYLAGREGGFRGKRILVIHSGGDSRRIPQYSALGKLFSPVPHELPDGRSSTLFDEILITMSAMPGRIRTGMVLLSGDVLLLFNPLLIDYPGHGAAAVSFKEDVQTGRNHGVYLRGEDGCVRRFLHKQSVETLRGAGAVNDAGDVDIDTGAVIFGTDVLEALWSLIADGDTVDEARYRRFVNDTVRLSLYGDFQYPMAADSTLERFYDEKPEGAYSDALREARTAVWHALRPFRLKLLRLAPARFIHFGTTGEILRLMNEGTEEYRALGWSDRVGCSMERGAGYNSIVETGARLGEGCYLESSFVHAGAAVGRGSMLSCVELEAGMTVPPDVVLHALRQTDGTYVCRIFGTGDNPKEDRLFGIDLGSLGVDLWGGGEHTLWNARLYPRRDTMRGAVEAALRLWREVREGRRPEGGCSLAEGFGGADPQALLAWNRRMRELIAMDRIGRAIDAGEPAENVRLRGPLTDVQRAWLDARTGDRDTGRSMRLHYYVGRALGGSEGEREIACAFTDLRRAVLTANGELLRENPAARRQGDAYAVSLPLRVNWGGGWSDTAPYCVENGGTVLNAAVLLGGERPVRAAIEATDSRSVILESRDMDIRGEFTDLSELQRVGDPFDPFVLQKAALLACGLIPAEGGRMEEVLERLGGGFRMNTEVTGVPKGSGLGTSSILCAACARALCGFFGIPYTMEELYTRVFCMEQIMSTGGGWQDQAGGLTDGVKYLTTRPGMDQRLTVEPVRIGEEAMRELNDRFVLIYTGQRRLARNLLRDVVGRYLGGDPQTLYALNEIQRKAALMRFELERGHIDAFAALLSEHWELSGQIDAGSGNTVIDQIFDTADDLLAGKMICGAGGGGFLQGVLKKGVGKADLEARLRSVFRDTDVRLWDCRLV